MNNERRTVYEGKWLRVKICGRWEYAERTHADGLAVIIIAVTPEKNLVLVEQFRVPVNSKSIEMPAGLVGDVHADETLALSAERELLEETGWQAGRIELLMTGPSSPGFSSERVCFVRATGLTRVHAGGGDAHEDIRVHEVPVADAPRWLTQKMSEGYEVDPRLWAGLWLIDRNPDGSPA
jgi:ADP-ribose pyrophosphatase